MQINSQIRSKSMDVKNHRHIDWDLCVQLAGNKPNLAKEMLIMFMDELPTAQSNIQEAYAIRDYKALHNHIHKLHGAACYCGVPFLKAILAEFESKLKTKEQGSLAALMTLLNDEIEHVRICYNRIDLAQV